MSRDFTASNSFPQFSDAAVQASIWAIKDNNDAPQVDLDGNPVDFGKILQMAGWGDDSPATKPAMTAAEAPVIQNMVDIAGEKIGGAFDGLNKLGQMAEDVTDATKEVMVAGAAISSAVAASALDAVYGMLGNKNGKDAEDMSVLSQMHVATVVADMTDGAVSLGELSDPTRGIEAAQQFANDKANAAMMEGGRSFA